MPTRLPLIRIAQYERLPSWMLTLTEDTPDGERPIDLSRVGTRVTLYFTDRVNHTLKTKVELIPGPDASAGQCLLDMPEEAVDTPGLYEFEVHVRIGGQLRHRVTYERPEIYIRPSYR